MMNPILNELAATERLADLRRAGMRSRFGHASDLAGIGDSSSEHRRGRVRRPQEAVGWLLVSVGLRLVVPRPPAGSPR